MALQRTRRPRFRSGRSLCSLGSPLNAQLLGGTNHSPRFREEILCLRLSRPNALPPLVSFSLSARLPPSPLFLYQPSKEVLCGLKL
jgi:hypothetical protein